MPPTKRRTSFHSGYYNHLGIKSPEPAVTQRWIEVVDAVAREMHADSMPFLSIHMSEDECRAAAYATKGGIPATVYGKVLEKEVEAKASDDPILRLALEPQRYVVSKTDSKLHRPDWPQEKTLVI